LILVDSTLYINWLRSRTEFTSILEQWVRSGTLVTCGVIRFEVVRGVLNLRQRRRVEQFFNLIPEIPLGSKDWREVAELAWRLDRAGKILPLADLIISVCGLSTGATVISLGKHFMEVPGLNCRDYV